MPSEAVLKALRRAESVSRRRGPNKKTGGGGDSDNNTPIDPSNVIYAILQTLVVAHVSNIKHRGVAKDFSFTIYPWAHIQ